MSLFDKSPKSETPTRGMFARLSDGLAATRQALSRGLTSFLGETALTPAQLEDLEMALLQADVGVPAAERIVAELSHNNLPSALRPILLKLIEVCEQPLTVPAQARPFVIMVVGVNGAGKTTTIGKLAHHFQTQGLKVMLAAGDTFRAAAVEQLVVWGERNGVPVIAQAHGADAAAVTHDALHAAKARDIDVLIVDTAGRLHTQSTLMDELKKIRRVIERVIPQAPHEVLLVLDAGVGQNALAQREHFQAAVGVTGLVLTKLDGTAKGGVLFALAAQKPIPVRFIGVGEGIDDLRVFNAGEFIDAILPKPV